MRYKLGYVFAVIFAVVAFGIASTAEANHGFGTLDIPECQAYINILETDDQLYLCRTTAVELVHGDPTDTLGAAGTVLILRDNGLIIRTIAFVNTGFALTAIYFDAQETDIPPWNASTTVLHISENPAFFVSPATTTALVADFNVNTDLAATAVEITSDLPQMMLRLEIDDSSVSQETYVTGTSITPAGKNLITAAYSPLGIIAVGAFGLPIADAGGAFTNPSDPAFVVDFEAVGASSTWAISVRDFGISLGFPYSASVLLVMFILFIAIIGTTFFFTRSTEMSYLFLWPVMFVGSSIGGWPLPATIMVAVVACILAMWIMIQRQISG